MKPATVLSAVAGAGAGIAIDRAVRSGAARLARLSGSTLGSPIAVAWITDFLNAAYYAKPEEDRDLDDLRLAHTVLTTYWNQKGTRQLGLVDVLRFISAFGTARLRGGGGTGLLETDALLEGGGQLLGEHFPDAARDWDRLGWGIAFPTADAKAQHDPEARLAHAKVGELTPPRRPLLEQVWHTYPPVEVPDAAATAAALRAVEHWPDYASELGRMTPLRHGGLDEQTFEIEVVGPVPKAPVLVRAYVSVTALVTPDDPAALETWVGEVRSGFTARGERPPIPDGAEVVMGIDLTCHEGHFMGDAQNRLVVYTSDGRSWLRAVGTWDPMAWDLAELYDRVGRHAQHAFWGMASPRESMLHQVAEQVARHGEEIGR